MISRRANPGIERHRLSVLVLIPTIVFMIAVAVFALRDGERLSWIGMMLSVVSLGAALSLLSARRAAVQPTIWGILWTTLWPVPLALTVVLVAVSFINENTPPGSTRRNLLYLGCGLIMVTAGAVAFVWWMREARRHRPAETVGRG